MDKINEGIEVVKQATVHDTKGHVDEAIYLYDLALKLFSSGLATITDLQTQKVVSQKCAEYNARLVALKSQPRLTPSVQQPAFDLCLFRKNKIVAF